MRVFIYLFIYFERSHAALCVYACLSVRAPMCFAFFYFGVGIVLGSWRLRLKSVGESYEF